MELLIGVAVGLFIQSIIKAGWRMVNPPTPMSPQPPQTAAQQANRAAYDELEANTPRVVSVRYQRRTTRGWRRQIMEREEVNFDE